MCLRRIGNASPLFLETTNQGHSIVVERFQVVGWLKQYENLLIPATGIHVISKPKKQAGFTWSTLLQAGLLSATMVFT